MAILLARSKVECLMVRVGCPGGDLELATASALHHPLSSRWFRAPTVLCLSNWSAGELGVMELSEL